VYTNTDRQGLAFVPVAKRHDQTYTLDCGHPLHSAYIWFPDSNRSLCFPCAERVRETDAGELCFGAIPLACSCDECQERTLEAALDVCRAVLVVGKHLPHTLADLIPLAQDALARAGEGV
jgi:hypothetical protein